MLGVDVDEVLVAVMGLAMLLSLAGIPVLQTQHGRLVLPIFR